MVTKVRKQLRIAGLASIAALWVGPLLAAPTTVENTTRTPAEWRTQKLEFTYMGFTAFYTYEGLESKVRYILLTFGARKDAKVHAVGCDRANNYPNKTAWVETEFSSLAPATDASKADAVPAEWGKVQLAASRPHDMGMGECELIDQMRPLLEKGFAMRNADYHAFCVPKQISVGDYSVNAEILRPASN